MLHFATVALLAVLSGLPESAPAPAPGHDDSMSQMIQRGARTRLRARFGDKDAAQAAADYREVQAAGGTVIRFNLQVEDALPNTTYDIALNGVVFAHITTDGLGGGEINLKSLTDDSGGNGSIPTMVAGDEISVVGVGAGLLEVH